MNNNIGYIKIPNFGSGFFSNFFVVLSMIIESDRQKLKPYVNLNNTAFVPNYNPYNNNKLIINEDTPNTWNWWFFQDELNKNSNIINIEFTLKNFNHTTKIWKRHDIPFIKSIINKYIKIRQNILEEVDYYYDNHFKNHVVLGVMARGSEMNTIHPQYGNQTIETWINSIKNILKKHPEVTLIFLVTEDSNYIPIFLNEFENIFYLKDVFRRTNETLEYMTKHSLWPCIVEPRENHCKRLGEECLIQALLLSKCDYLLIKQCGTSSGAIVFANNNLKNVFYT